MLGKGKEEEEHHGKGKEERLERGRIRYIQKEGRKRKGIHWKWEIQEGKKGTRRGEKR